MLARWMSVNTPEKKKQNPLHLSVSVFSTKVLINWGQYFTFPTGDGTAIL